MELFNGCKTPGLWLQLHGFKKLKLWLQLCDPVKASTSNFEFVPMSGDKGGGRGVKMEQLMTLGQNFQNVKTLVLENSPLASVLA